MKEEKRVPVRLKEAAVLFAAVLTMMALSVQTEAAPDRGIADTAEEAESAGSGTVILKTDGAESEESQDTVYYSKEVSVEFSVSQEGSYTASYLKDGRKEVQEISQSGVYTAVLTDSGKEGDPHPVYDDFEISGTDKAGNSVPLSAKPDKAIVIDTRGPVIDFLINRKRPGSFSFFRDQPVCSVFADDRNGAGADPDQYSYCIRGESGSPDELRHLPEGQWTAIHPQNGEHSFALSDRSGVIWLRVKDRLGNISYRKAGSFVQEEQEPVIRVKITDPDQREIYECTSEEAEGERPGKLSEYYRTLNVQVSVTEQPAKEGSRGYSGISRISWALVPHGADLSCAEENREDLAVNNEPADLQELYGNERYKNCVMTIDPRKLVEKITAKEKGYEESGSYDLCLWAVDFCGNGEDFPLRIPVLLDAAAPAVTVQMEGGTEYRGMYYYRAENWQDSADERDTAAVTVLAFDDRSDGSVRNLTAVLKGAETEEVLSKQADGNEPGKLVFTAEDLKEQFGETEQEITISVSAEDGTGNETNLIEKEGSRGIRLESDGRGGWKSGSFIRDAVSPRVRIQYACDGKEGLHVYQKDSGSGEPDAFSVYTCGDAAVTFETDEAYAGKEGLFWSISGAVPSGGALESGSGTSVSLTVPEGEEKAFDCTAYGRDIAGNPAIVEECFAEDADVKLHPETIGIKEKYRAAGCSEKGDHVPVFRLVIDRKSPEIMLRYSIDTGLNPASAAFVYDDQSDEENVLTAYLSGVMTAKAFVEEAEEEIDLSRLYFVNPGEKARSWDRTAVGSVSPGGGEKYPCIGLSSVSRDGRYLYRVYGTDRAGNRANVTECFEEGCHVEKMYEGEKELTGKREKVDESYTPCYEIVIDTTAPAVSEIVTRELAQDGEGELKEAGDASPSYYEDDGTFYYKSKGLRTIWRVDESNFDSRRLSAAWLLDGCSQEKGITVRDREILVTFLKEGKYEKVSVCGTDRAGNHIKMAPVSGSADPSAKAGSGSPAVNPSQNDAVTVREQEGEGRDAFGLIDTHVELNCPRILDRHCPVAEIMHVVPDGTTGYLYPEKEAGSSAALYSAGAVTSSVSASDTYGEGDGEKPVRLDKTKLIVKTVFHVPGGPCEAPLEEKWGEQGSDPQVLAMNLKTRKEGACIYTVEGTDRAGNPVMVRESIKADADRKAFLDTEKGHYDKGNPGDPEERSAGKDGICSSFYEIVYDKTPPAYLFKVNHPSNLQETFDRRTGISYYGKSVSSVQACFQVTEQNFDEERILAGIASKSSRGKDRMENLSPGWTVPDVKGTCRREDGLTTAVFSLQIEADRQYEGIYRFEIAGCDKAGNALVPSNAQAAADRSDSLENLAARTEPVKNIEGGFWSQRKAVDVTAPTGFMKVESTTGRNKVYYEIRFELGGNIPVMYEPFRPEKQARLIIGTEDASPVSICFALRSEDSKKDQAFQRNNPVRSAGQNTYGTDNSLELTVNGEQVFHLENLLIKDRAGNVRANDPDSSCTLAKSGNIYLDAAKPDVSAIKDAESPRVMITASGTFTRHEGDGERYIYRPGGSALDLKVSIADPGGKAHSSGLKEVTVEIRVGDTLVTDKVNMLNLPYFYEKGSRTGHNPLRYEIPNGRIRIPTGSFAESNDITVTVKARDNSGNCSVPSKDGGLLKLGIDTTAPRVEVNYHDTAEPRHGKYFRAGRTAEIVVIDRNVVNENIKIETNIDVPASFTAPHVYKEHDGRGESGNDDRWIKTLRYDADGDYTLQISGTDALGNRISDIKWNGLAPQNFTIDKTRPVIRILLPKEVNKVDGVKYYDAPTKARVEIQEHNFSEETGSELLKVETRAVNHSGAEKPPIPHRTAFQKKGSDLYTSTIDCEKDGDYEIRASYTDLAGNEAVEAGGEGRRSECEAGSGRFTIDTSAPELRIDPQTFRVDSSSGLPLQGLEKQIYTDKDFAPRIIIRDINYDERESDFSIDCSGADLAHREITLKEGDQSRGEYIIRFKAFEMTREMDGVYRVHVKAIDLAKHRSDLEFCFSVNRFGSTWVCADEATRGKLQAYYINDTREPLRILELSPVELTTHAAEVFKDHERRILAEGKQYTFEEAPAETEKSKTVSSRHRVYIYTIAPEVYEEEGVYDFILSSTDPAGNKNTTALFRDGTVEADRPGQVKFPIELQVDKTVPVNRITGVKKGKEQFNTDRLKIKVYPEDYQTEIRDVKVRIWKGDWKGKGTLPVPEIELYYRKIGREEDAGALAAGHIYPIEEAKKGISVIFDGNSSWQFLEVITTDLAGNESIDLRAGDPGRNLPDTRRRFLVTTNPLIRLLHSRSALCGLPAAAVLVYLLTVLKKKREKDESIDKS